MKKEIYQSTLDFVCKKAKKLDIPFISLYWNLDGVMSCAVQDEEIDFKDFSFLMTYKNTILEDCKK